MLCFPSSLCSVGDITKVCGRPVWDHLQHGPSGQRPAAGHQVHVWLPGRAGGQTQHPWPTCSTHMEEQLVSEGTKQMSAHTHIYLFVFLWTWWLDEVKASRKATVQLFMTTDLPDISGLFQGINFSALQRSLQRWNKRVESVDLAFRFPRSQSDVWTFRKNGCVLVPDTVQPLQSPASKGQSCSGGRGEDLHTPVWCLWFHSWSFLLVHALQTQSVHFGIFHMARPRHGPVSVPGWTTRLFPS